MTENVFKDGDLSQMTEHVLPFWFSFYQEVCDYHSKVGCAHRWRTQQITMLLCSFEQLGERFNLLLHQMDAASNEEVGEIC